MRLEKIYDSMRFTVGRSDVWKLSNLQTFPMNFFFSWRIIEKTEKKPVSTLNNPLSISQTISSMSSRLVTHRFSFHAWHWLSLFRRIAENKNSDICILTARSWQDASELLEREEKVKNFLLAPPIFAPLSMIDFVWHENNSTRHNVRTPLFFLQLEAKRNFQEEVQHTFKASWRSMWSLFFALFSLLRVASRDR